jgi:hypothetical protein
MRQKNSVSSSLPSGNSTTIVYLWPEFTQEVMEDVFPGMKDVKVYIDDIGIWGQRWEHHQVVVTEVLKCLEDNGFTVNL